MGDAKATPIGIERVPVGAVVKWLRPYYAKHIFWIVLELVNKKPVGQLLLTTQIDSLESSATHLPGLSKL